MAKTVKPPGVRVRPHTTMVVEGRLVLTDSPQHPVRDFAKRMWHEVRMDYRFCFDAVKAGLAEGWWRTIMTSLGRLHRAINLVLGTGLLAITLLLYFRYVYPTVGKRWTAIFILLTLTATLLIAIRFTRILHDNTVSTFNKQTEDIVARLTREHGEQTNHLAERITALEERLRPNLLIDYRPEEGEPFVQTDENGTQYRISITSPVEVREVELVANRVRTGSHKALPNLHLRPIHDRNRDGTKRVTLKADKENYWDLISTHGGAVHLTCIASLGAIPLSVGDYEFELMATGTGVAATKIVALKINEDNTTKLDIRDGRLTRSILVRD